MKDKCSNLVSLNILTFVNRSSVCWKHRLFSPAPLKLLQLIIPCSLRSKWNLSPWKHSHPQIYKWEKVWALLWAQVALPYSFAVTCYEPCYVARIFLGLDFKSVQCILFKTQSELSTSKSGLFFGLQGKTRAFLGF